MKVLFLCKSNVGRSQIAEALFNKYSSKNIGISAGTNASKYKDIPLSQISENVVKCMKNVGLDISKKKPIQLIPDLVEKVDKVIVITAKENLPDYLCQSNKVIFWNDIPDARDQSYEFHNKIRDAIEQKIKKLVLEIG